MPNQIPVVTVANINATHGQNLAGSSLFGYVDGDGDAALQYQFWDATAAASSGHFLINGVERVSNQVLGLTAAQLAQASFQSGSGTDQLWVRAFDGFDWSAWQSFTVTAPQNQVPVATVTNINATHGQNLAGSSLFNYADGDGDAAKQYQFWDATAAASSGHFLVNGMVQGSNQAIDVTAAQLAQASFQGSGTDQLWVRAFDGFDWSAWQNFTVTAPQNQVPVVTVANINATHGQNLAGSSLFNYADGDGDAAKQFQFWDATAAASSGHFLVNGVVQGSNQAIDVTAAQLAQASFKSGSGADQLWVRAFDGFDWSAWQNFTVTGPQNQVPVVTVFNVNLAANAVLSAFGTYNDGDGDPATQYQFWDATAAASSGNFFVDEVVQGSNQAIDVMPGELLTFHGSGTDQLWARAFDGFDWSAWKSFTVTAPQNQVPVVTVANINATHGQNLAGSSMINYADGDGDAALQYQFWDATAAASSGHFLVNGVTQGSNQAIDVTAAQLAQASFQSGSGADQLWVRAFDGVDWSAWKNFTVTAPQNQVPVATVANINATHGQNLAGSSLFNYADGDSDAAKQFQFWDATAAASSGRFLLNGVEQGSNQAIDVTAAELAQASFQGSGTDQLWVRAFDGFDWSAWQNFTVTAPQNQVPVVTVASVNAIPGQNLAGSSLFGYADGDGDAALKFQFWDATAADSSGHFVVNGVVQASNQAIDLTPAQLDNTSFLVGTVSDDLWVRANDGVHWSQWTNFQVFDV